MLDTSRLRSNFDIELHLGRGWLFTAIDLLQQEGQLTLPFGLTIDNLFIIDDPDWDIEVHSLGAAIAKANISFGPGGQSLNITTDNPLVPPVSVPFGGLGQLAGTPTIIKVLGDSDHDNAMALLANIDLRASSQDGDPLPAGTHLARGNAANVQPYLPTGKDVAFGMGMATFSRLANHIWHDQLADDDGGHPLPDADNKLGDWDRVSATPRGGNFLIRIEGDVEADSPVIDIIPDPHVEFDIEISPQIGNNGRLFFEMDTDLDIDTGFWGDVFAFFAGGIIGFPLALLTGGVVNPINVGIGAVIALEVAEEIVEGQVLRKMRERGSDPHSSCNRDIVRESIPPLDEQKLSVGALDAIPSNIPMYTDNSLPLYQRFVGVQTINDELAMNPMGLGAAGMAAIGESYLPRRVVLSGATRDGAGALTDLQYDIVGANTQHTISTDEAITRIAEGEITLPVNLQEEFEDGSFRIYEGKLACVCLEPNGIHREESVVTHLRFDGDVVLTVPECVDLQKAGVINLHELQLIEANNASAYFRSPPDDTTDNNLESLPEFDL